jgi:hypothetical protein
MNQIEDVRVENVGGRWTVFVFEDGETSCHDFENEQFARNYADGQRLRVQQLRKPAVQAA